MKKVLLMIAIVAAGFTVNAQESELNVGGTIGIPSGDSKADVTGAIEVNYLFKVSEELKVGGAISHIHFLGDGADAAFLPIAAAGRFTVSEKFSLGLDMGYGIGVRPSENTESGFYYRPMVGYKVTNAITAHVDYAAVVLDQTTLSSFGIGATYSFSL
ncbi:outer membrane beta-barrel protein [Tenacibaculum dicentrarchi]|uniref:outer membrane beta-barrel protein n=1 Tax=Tenacibaculum dicentrarchi TaxID=669041 RepID=UPI000C64232E|nr:conserved exported hypothetical protein [Tenacibaculum dicentrarchi]SOU86555.1 conserved exported hypothetical protein [Tenacibaculum dicentrarchi]